MTVTGKSTDELVAPWEIKRLPLAAAAYALWLGFCLLLMLEAEAFIQAPYGWAFYAWLAYFPVLGLVVMGLFFAGRGGARAIRGMALGALAIGVVTFGVRIHANPPGTSEIVQSSLSPDRAYLLEVVEINANSLDPYQYVVQVRRVGARLPTTIAAADAATRSETAWGMNARWLSNSEVMVTYFKARGTAYRVPRPPKVGGRTISVKVQSGVVDPTAPG